MDAVSASIPLSCFYSRFTTTPGPVMLSAAKNPHVADERFFPFVPQGYGSRARNDRPLSILFTSCSEQKHGTAHHTVEQDEQQALQPDQFAITGDFAE